MKKRLIALGVLPRVYRSGAVGRRLSRTGRALKRRHRRRQPQRTASGSPILRRRRLAFTIPALSLWPSIPRVNLVTINGLYGVEANIGAYGTHSWRTALLGVDYRGIFPRVCERAQLTPASIRFLTLGYTWQQSRRIIWKAQVLGGIPRRRTRWDRIRASRSPLPIHSVVRPASLLFDSRSYYLQGGLDLTMQQTAANQFHLRRPRLRRVEAVLLPGGSGRI